jgi:TRAP-type C4-dicarboxylate transport system permease small subunit
MTPIIGNFRAGNALLSIAVNVLLCVILAVMVLVVGIQISARFLGISVIWTSEVTQYLLLWLTFLGMATVYRSSGHIAVDLCVKMLPQAVRDFEQRGVHLALAVFFAVFAGVAVDFMWTIRASRAATLDMSMMWPYLALPVGSTISVLFAVELAVEPTPHQAGSGSLA